MGFVVGMHLALLLVLARGFGVIPTTVIPHTDATIIDEPIVRDEPRPIEIKERFEPNMAIVVPQPIPLDLTDDTVIDPPPGVIIGGDEGIGGSGAVEPQIVRVRADPKHPLSQPPYPPTDRREGNQGSVDVEIYVMPDGRVGDARIVKSSGFERLDQVTLDEARRSWRMLPATRNGEPFAQWHRLRVVFKLTTR
jgi:protein TonB